MGLFGLTRREKKIWEGIEQGNKIRLFLLSGFSERYDSVVENVTEKNIYVQTPKVGNAYLEVANHTRFMVEIDLYKENISKIRFLSELEDYHWFQEKTMRFSLPRSINFLELRRYLRVDVDVDGEFSFVENSGSTNLDLGQPCFSVHVKNVSEGGALLLVDKLMSVQKGAVVNIQVHLNTGFTVRARARVVHIEPAHRKYGIGIEFSYLSSIDKKRLKACISLQSGREKT